MEVILENVVKGFGPTAVLNIPSAKFASGSQTVLMGNSGVGKSTLLNLLAGVLKPEKGRILLGETEISKLKEHQRDAFRSRHLGYIFQNFNLLPELTVLENVRMSGYFSGKPVDDKTLMDLLEKTGIHHKAHAYPGTLSVGQRQRIAIVRAISVSPGILLADEPTGALDKKNKEAVLDLLKSLATEIGSTLILVTHDEWVSDQLKNTLSLEDLNEVAP